MSLNGTVSLVTGGARIGIVVAEELAKKGSDVVITYRHSKNEAGEAARRVQHQSRKALIVKADVSKERDVIGLMKLIRAKMRRLDILINMASIYGETPFGTLTQNVWDEYINSNLKTAFLTSIHAYKDLLKTRGRIINISDWVAASGRPRYKSFIPYYTAKTGIIGLTQAMALEMAPNILVNCIAPGPILPPPQLKNEEVRDIKKVTPLQKWGGAMEIAQTVIFLCETHFITGEVIRVDGGRHLL